MSSEEPIVVLGSKGLIRKLDLVKAVIEWLWSLGLTNSASCLESESGILGKYLNSESLRSQVLAGNWEDCVHSLEGFKDLSGETKLSAQLLILEQRLVEHFTSRQNMEGVTLLQKEVSALGLGHDKVRKLSSLGITVKKDMGSDEILELRKNVVKSLEDLLPPPILLRERRLENLVEAAIAPQVMSCLYHNSSGPVSILVDHICGADQMPTHTVQVLENRGWIIFLEFSPNGKFMVSSSSDFQVIIWKVQDDGTLTLERKLRDLQKQITFVAWSPDNEKLLTFGKKEELKLWDVATGSLRRTFTTDDFTVSSCAWFPDSDRFIFCSSDLQKRVSIFTCDSFGHVIKVENGGLIPVILALTPDGETLISVVPKNRTSLKNLVTNMEMEVKEKSAMSLSLSRDGKVFVVNASDNHNQIRLFDTRGARSIYDAEMLTEPCIGGLDCNFIASGSTNKKVYIWKRNSSKPICVLFGHSLSVRCVSWNPVRHQMPASGGTDGTIRIWGSLSVNNLRL